MKNQAKLFFHPLNAIEMIYLFYLKLNVIGSFLKKNVNSFQRLSASEISHWPLVSKTSF